ncbi:hypothetical protein N7468_008484 [Penicillium chermesinum]|uniref:Uncharacterized protein n=1 Tax=Penicillium chermesinum TaxID=63820 RepID=A0A9W9NPX1_9EURO|nr:uncharacterized protein N7468_008484 [Penicillium chermesinum]KAJ5223942.1 hypothetical protein N7468_008484 [Penicillium chermesinum]
MQPSMTNTDRPVSILFGPQCEDVKKAASEIRTRLAVDDSVNFIVEALEDLPSAWSGIIEAWAPLSEIPGERQLHVLTKCLTTSTSDAPVDPTNVLLTPLTVLEHILKFTKIKEEMGNQIINTQGFCVGFLAAVVVACSENKEDLKSLTRSALHLAVSIGALVDLDELTNGRSRSIVVRWKNLLGRKAYQKILSYYPGAYTSCVVDTDSVTITAPEEKSANIIHDLTASNLTVKVIGLKGRFHNDTHRPAVDRLIEYFSNDERFSVPSSRMPGLGLRSNVDGEAIRGGNICAVALESILVAQCKWLATAAGTLDSMRQHDDQPRFVIIGPNSLIPRSIRNQLADQPVTNSIDQHVNHVSNGLTNGIAPLEVENDAQVNGMTTQGHDEPTGMPIAIVGMACRYPQADSVEKLWEMLELGRCAVSELPNERFKMNEFGRKPDGPFFGNFLEEPDTFDHRFFGISAREAESMDPQQRLLLQVAYNAMESAGYCGLESSSITSDIGCYVGVGSDDYTDNVGSRDSNAFSATGTLQAFNSGRISHFFGWSGPSLTIDTACSSAAVALHLACKALQAKDCSIAMAGGVNVMTSPKVTQNLAAASFLSPTGASKAFDASADGYCRGEGAGLVLLRPLEDAIRNKDTILAVIAGSAVNQGSNCSPITVPVSNSQQTLYRKALKAAGISPHKVSYVEAHGTGTQVGDPIEFDSIRQVFGGPSRSEKLYVGSIKDNIGHTETSSGVAALLKTVLMIQNSRIPKQANFTQLNPKIPAFQHDNMIIPQQSVNWNGHRRVAMVTNYGAAGSNAALLVQEYEPRRDNATHAYQKLSEVPIFLSAKTPESLKSYCVAVQQFINGRAPESLGYIVQDVAYNLAKKQNRNLDYMVSLCADSRNAPSLLSQLNSVISNSAIIQKNPARSNPVILCFGGQTGATTSISKDLVESNELLKFHLMECERTCESLGLPSLFPVIFEQAPKLDLASLHCMLFSIQYASAKSWLDSGLKVERLVGHSFGQLTALCVAGSLSLADTMLLISSRATLIQSSWGPEKGKMLSMEGSVDDIKSLLDSTKDTVDIACVNGSRDIVLAGNEASIDHIEKSIAAQSLPIRAKRLGSTHGFHSRLVDAIIPGLKKVAQSLTYHKPKIPIEACSESDDWSFVDADKIANHSRNAVCFKAAVERAAQAAKGSAVWLEAGSASPVIPMIRRIIQRWKGSDGHFFQAMNLEGPQAQHNLANATSNLWLKGVRVQFWAFHDYQSSSYKSLNLPPYQFEKAKHWIEFDPGAFAPQQPPVLSPERDDELVNIIEQKTDEALFSVNTSHPVYHLCATGHAVVGQHLCPASLYVEILLKAVSKLSKGDLSGMMPQLQNLSICAPLILESEGDVFLRLSQNHIQKNWSFNLFTRQKPPATETHATGEIGLHKVDGPSQFVARFRSLGRLITSSRSHDITNSPRCSGLMGSTVYSTFDRVVKYADYYHGVRKVFASGHEATGSILLESQTSDGICDPILVDNYLQVAGLHVNCLSQARNDEVFVCSGIGDIFFSDSFIGQDGKPANSSTVYTSYDRPSPKQAMCDIFAFDTETGKLLVAIMSATFTSLSMVTLTRALKRLNKNVNDADTEPKGSLSQQKPHMESSDNLQTVQSEPSGCGHLRAIQEMFNTLLGIPLEELLPSSGLEDIGVDSLMRTEVLSEIKQRFGVDLSSAALMEVPDIQSLVQMIFPDMSPNTPTGPSVSQMAIEPSSEENITPNGESHQVTTVEESRELAELSRSIFRDIRHTTAHSDKTQWTGFCETVHPQQMTLVTAYVIEAFQALGIPLETLKSGDFIPELPVLPQHQQVKGQLYSILEYSRLVRKRGDLYLRTDEPIPATPSSVLHEKIIQMFPRHVPEHQLLRTTGSKLAACLTGDTDPLAILFQDKKARELIGDVYTHAPMFFSATMHLTQFLRSVLSNCDPSRQIKILEIGAGTGGTTGFLLSQLADISELKFQYTFTDLSSSLITLARKKFKAYNFIHYTTLDIDRDPPQNMLGQYDIILSSNCVHATPNISRSTENIRKLLKPDGILCLIELTRNLFWFDLVFGLLEGWWKFDDGREHALSTEHNWDKALRQAGYNWVDWSDNHSKESEILRLIVASPANMSFDRETLVTEETVTFAEKDGVKLQADIYYPAEVDTRLKPRPIALMIHGGGHVMLSPQGRSLKADQDKSLLEGPMQDCRDALHWARSELPQLRLLRNDVKPDGDQVVAVGWSTGGHLAMTLGWTPSEIGVRSPEAILSFYSPTDYEDDFWTKSNLPFDQPAPPEASYNPWEAISDTPITSYNPSAAKAGWMSPHDPRSLIALHMNWKGQTLPILMSKKRPNKSGSVELNFPSPEEIQAISPLAQIRAKNYHTPTFIVHGMRDDLIPISQTQRTTSALSVQDVDSDFRVIDALHLFDIYPENKQTNDELQSVVDGYKFLSDHVQ